MSDVRRRGRDQHLQRRPGRDRRAAPRQASDALISLQPLAQPRDRSLAGLIRDVSPGGMSLILTQRFTPGTLLGIDLSEVAGGEPAPVVARVVHVARREDGKWVLGCALQKELTGAQVRACRPESHGDMCVSIACVPVPEENW
jgi:hypothetical protein